MPKKEQIMIDTAELREVLKQKINSFGGREVFCRAAGMSINTLNGKLSRRKRKNGGYEEIYLNEFKNWYYILTGEEFIHDKKTLDRILTGKKTLEEQLKALDYYYKCLEMYS